MTELGYTHKVLLVLRESADRTVDVRALRRFDELGVPIGAGIGVAAGIVVGAWAVHLGGIPGAGLGALVLGIASVLALRTAPLSVADDAGDRAREAPVDAKAEPAPAEEDKPTPAVAEPLEMIEIVEGDFLMGSERGAADERPVHRVRVAPFAMGKTPVTQGLYREVMGASPGDPQGDDLPVNNVSWFDAVDFCNRLSDRAGLQRCYKIEDTKVAWDRSANGYRLPTEEEWEYAARAGTTTEYSFGDDPAQLDEYAWYSENSRGRIQPVAHKKPNPWGLYDMHGNIWEWCWDRYAPYNELSIDLQLSEDSQSSRAVARVVRGGSFISWSGILRAVRRDWVLPAIRDGDLGFRCVRGSGRQH